MNHNIVLISGKSGTGKSASLQNLKNPEGVMYLNCENNKALPFKSKFIKGKDGKPGLTIKDPMQIYAAFDQAEKMPACHSIIVDTVTFMMDMYEAMYVLTSENTLQAWGNYAQFFKKLMMVYVARSTKNVIFLAHTSDEINDDKIRETVVKVKGSLNTRGIESFFTTVISTKKLSIKQVEEEDEDGKRLYESDLLNISRRERRKGIKYCFQTDVDGNTLHERMRGPISMWEEEELFIDNDIQLVLDRIHEYNE